MIEQLDYFQRAADLLQCGELERLGFSMDTLGQNQIVEIRLTYRYAQAHPWVVQAVTGFFSAYFMEHPGFRVQRHFDELETGMHVWVCDVPPTMKVPSLMRRLQADIPPCRYQLTTPHPPARPQYVIDLPGSEPPIS